MGGEVIHLIIFIKEMTSLSSKHNEAYLRTKICGQCGKEFIHIPGSIYKRSIHGKLVRYCCYTCYRKSFEQKS